MQPPQNPYNQPGYGQPENPYGGPVGQQPRGTVSLDVIGESWSFVKASIGPWIVAMLIAGVVFIILSVISNLIQRPFAPTAGQRPGGGFYLMLLISQILSAVVTTVISAGLLKMAITQVRTGVASVGEMTSATNVLGSLIVAALLTALVTYIGFILCIVPGVIASLGLAMTQPLIVDQGMGGVDAMKRSWEAMKPHLGSFFVLGLVLGLINIAGALACGLGLFVTYPMTIVAMSLVYRDLFSTGGPVMPNSGYTPPPIANPNF